MQLRRNKDKSASELGGAFVGSYNPGPANSDQNKVTKKLFWHHFQGNPARTVLRYKKGSLVSTKAGDSFWFHKLTTAIAEVPTDNQELPILFAGRSLDFQDVTIQGILSYRVSDPAVIADRIDFTIDLDTGRYVSDPKVKIESFLSQIAQQATSGYLSTHSLDELITAGVNAVRAILVEAFAQNEAVIGLGLEVLNISVASLKPRADVEKALQVPTFEQLQEKADQATFERRAKAVEKERTIQTNEQQTQLTLEKNREELITQQGANQRRVAEDAAEVARLQATSHAEVTQINVDAEATAIVTRGEAKSEAEKAALGAYEGISSSLLTSLALRELATHLETIGAITITPDLLQTLAGQLVAQNSNGNGNGDH